MLGIRPIMSVSAGAYIQVPGAATNLAHGFLPLRLRLKSWVFCISDDHRASRVLSFNTPLDRLCVTIGRRISFSKPLRDCGSYAHRRIARRVHGPASILPGSPALLLSKCSGRLFNRRQKQREPY